MGQLLQVENLHTTFDIHVGSVQAVRGISLSVDEGESVGIVGESGCGKSVSMMSIMRLLPKHARVTADKLVFGGLDLLSASDATLRSIEGDRIGIVFQDPMTSLNPLFTVEKQLIEPMRIHRRMGKAEARENALRILKTVDMPDPESRLKQYPHELSGGMRQRVMIAMAIALEPQLVIADEPTTALDVTIQAQILDLLRDLKSRLNSSIILITHDLGVIAGMCERVIVMYAGKILEEGSVRELFYEPKHPYTWGLLRSRPAPNGEKRKLIPIPGTPPDLIAPPPGCPFAPRCPHAMHICNSAMPHSTRLSDTHSVSCYLMDAGAPKIEWGGHA